MHLMHPSPPLKHANSCTQIGQERVDIFGNNMRLLNTCPNSFKYEPNRSLSILVITQQMVRKSNISTSYAQNCGACVGCKV